MFDSSFWALIGLFLFFGILVYFKVPGMITRGIDSRGDKIRNELEEARRLREEAQQLLAEYQRKRKEAESEAESIVEAARSEAEHITTEAKQKTEEYVERRTALAEVAAGTEQVIVTAAVEGDVPEALRTRTVRRVLKPRAVPVVRYKSRAAGRTEGVIH